MFHLRLDETFVLRSPKFSKLKMFSHFEAFNGESTFGGGDKAILIGSISPIFFSEFFICILLRCNLITKEPNVNHLRLNPDSDLPSLVLKVTPLDAKLLEFKFSFRLIMNECFDYRATVLYRILISMTYVEPRSFLCRRDSRFSH